MSLMLPIETENRIANESAEALDLFEAGEVDTALKQVNALWDSIPGDTAEEKLQYNAIQTVAADAALGTAKAGLRDLALDWLDRFTAAYYFTDDPYTLLHKGTVHYWLGNMAEAQKFFAESLAGGGKRMFQGEHPDFLKLAQGKKVSAPQADSRPTAGPTAGPAEYDDEKGDELAEAGNDALEAGNWQGAIELWRQGLALVPEPQDTFEAAGWFWASIADAAFEGGQYEDCVDAAQRAVTVDEMRTNAFVWLRLGQAQTELGNTDAAVEALTSAFMLGGHEVFNEEEPHYLQLLRDRGVKGV